MFACFCIVVCLDTEDVQLFQNPSEMNHPKTFISFWKITKVVLFKGRVFSSIELSENYEKRNTS